jgi:hypothetical protein
MVKLEERRKSVGTLAGSLNATVQDLCPEPNSTIFAGQHLRVKDGAAVVASGTGARTVFGRNTNVSFTSVQEGLTVQLEKGDVSLYVPRQREAAGERGQLLPVACYAQRPGSSCPYPLGYVAVGERYQRSALADLPSSDRERCLFEA